jgi:hypothetical protein
MAALRRDFLPLLEQGLLLSELLHDDGLTSAIRHAYGRAVRAVVGGPASEARTDDAPQRSDAECAVTTDLQDAADSGWLEQFDDRAGDIDEDGGHGRTGRGENSSQGSDSDRLGALHRVRDCGVQTHIALAPLSRTPLPPAGDSKSAEATAGAGFESPRTRMYASHFGVAWRVLFAPRRPAPHPAEPRNPATERGGARALPRLDSDTKALPALGVRRDSDRDRGVPTRCQPVAAPGVCRDSDSPGPRADSEEARRENEALSSLAADVWRLGPKASGLDSDRGSAAGVRSDSSGQQQPAGHTGVMAMGRCRRIEIDSKWASDTASASVRLTPQLSASGGDKRDMGLLVARCYLEGLACTCAMRIQQAVRARAARRAADTLRSEVVSQVLEDAIIVVQRQARCWIARRTRRNREAESVARSRYARLNLNLLFFLELCQCRSIL